MGGRCLEHERRSKRVFVRGRPFDGADPDSAPSGYGVATLAATGAVSTFEIADPAQLVHEIPRR